MTHHPIDKRRATLIFIGRATAVAFVLLITGCVHTAPFKDANGQIISGSIATMETAAIGGISQSIWFRGISRSSPALILLHGGPGASESALFRRYNSALEQHFLVVYWEQRGTGRSFHFDIPPESMAVARLVRDLDEVVERVRRRFGKDKVVLLAHSWGTVLGTIYAARYPEKVAAYVGIAQIADVPAGRHLSYEFAISEATKRGNSSAVSELEAIGPPPYQAVEGPVAYADHGCDQTPAIDCRSFGPGAPHFCGHWNTIRHPGATGTQRRQLFQLLHQPVESFRSDDPGLRRIPARRAACAVSLG